MTIKKKIVNKNNFLLTLLLLTGSLVNAQQGTWAAQLLRNDGHNIPFHFDWKTENGNPVWYIHNAAEKIKVSNITTAGDSLFIQMPVFESQFRILKNGKTLSGVWIKGGATKTTVIPFTATLGGKRFTAKSVAGKNISGRWASVFANSKDDLSVGEFKQTGNKVIGTFLNATGDYRFLEGIVTKDSVFFSGFDGGHAYLFTAKIESPKKLTGGDFYSGATYNEKWSAVKDAKAKVPLESVAMYLKPGEDSLHFTFKDIDGNTVSIKDERFYKKVIVVQLMGSWCPNCMDETEFLSDYYNNNKQRGVEVIALAYEYSTNWERSIKSLRKFKDRYDVRYTILNTGVTVTDSLRSEKTLPELTPIKFFPSSVIIDKKGKVRKLDTGFNGPATGEHYLAYKKEFEEMINNLLKEN